MCQTLIAEENKAFTVKELKEYLTTMDDDLPVNIHVMKKLEDGSDDGYIFPLESMGTNGEEISLVCYEN